MPKNILKVDDKWSIQYDPDNNYRPIAILRYGVETTFSGELKNVATAMFYALLKEREGE